MKAARASDAIGAHTGSHIAMRWRAMSDRRLAYRQWVRFLALGIVMTLAGTAMPRAPAGPQSERPQILSAYYGYNNCIGILCLQLSARFNPGWIEQLTTDRANSFGLQAFDPTGDAPNPAETISIVNESKPRQAGF
jgi:hypothetical protein